VVFGQFLTQRIGLMVVSLLFILALLLANAVWLFFGVGISKITQNTNYDRAISYSFGTLLFFTAIGLLVW
jgi:threonine/homoserine/homoserine lactone efflux protein